MRWKILLAASFGTALFAYGPAEAQSSQPPSFRSPTCDALCDLATAIKDGLPNAQRANAIEAAQKQPTATTATAPVAQAAPKKIYPRRIRAREPIRREGFRIYANSDVHGLDDLQGRSVSLGPMGSRSEALARKTLETAGVKVREDPLDADNAFDAMTLGAIDAMAVSSPKAYAMMDKIPARYGVHRIDLPRHDLARQGFTHKKTAALAMDSAR